MKGVWIEWKGYGDFHSGKVDVMFSGGEVVEANESVYWEWRLVTGDSMSEIVSYMQLADKKPKIERKKPWFTFEDGVDIAFECMEADVCLLPFILKGKGANEVALQLLRTYLKRTRHHDCYTYKPLRKKLKLYIKWLQSQSSAV